MVQHIDAATIQANVQRSRERHDALLTEMMAHQQQLHDLVARFIAAKQESNRLRWHLRRLRSEAREQAPTLPSHPDADAMLSDLITGDRVLLTVARLWRDQELEAFDALIHLLDMPA